MANNPTIRTTMTPDPLPAPRAAPIRPDLWPGWIPIALGAWLFISTFLWPHGTASTNTWIVGLLIAIASLIALRMPWMRWVDTALAIWLFLSTLAMPGATRATLWNNLIVALLVFLVSLVARGRVPDAAPADPRRRSGPRVRARRLARLAAPHARADPTDEPAAREPRRRDLLARQRRSTASAARRDVID